MGVGDGCWRMGTGGWALGDGYLMVWPWKEDQMDNRFHLRYKELVQITFKAPCSILGTRIGRQWRDLQSKPCVVTHCPSL